MASRYPDFSLAAEYLSGGIDSYSVKLLKNIRASYEYEIFEEVLVLVLAYALLRYWPNRDLQTLEPICIHISEGYESMIILLYI